MLFIHSPAFMSIILTCVCRFDSEPLQGDLSFTAAQPNWQQDIWTEFGEYIGEQFCLYCFISGSEIVVQG